MKNIKGQNFGRLTVLEYVGYREDWQVSIWLCRCICGQKRVLHTAALTSGHTQSCGCLRAERRDKATTIHGHLRTGKRSPEAICYYNAKARCNNPQNPAYRHYGGRGIKFLLPPFPEFYRAMGPRPKGMSLDRIDNDGHYELSNIRWASLSAQMKNRRRRWWNTRKPKKSANS
jgi:hypothetical protein